MNEQPVAKIAEFHQELLSMQRLGLPLELGFEPANANMAVRLDQIQRRLALQVNRQGELMQAIANDPDLPKPYRCALNTWVQCDHPTEVLDGLTVSGTARRTLHGQIGLAFVGPLILLAMVYLGCIYLCLHVYPQLESVYAQMWQPVGANLRLLGMLRAAMPVWVPGIPILIVLAAGWWSLRTGQLRFAWLLGSKRYFASIQTAAYARQLATLLDAGFSTGQSLARVGPLPLAHRLGDSDLATANVYLSTAEDIGQQVQHDDPTIAALPPLLRWALLGQLDAGSRSCVLRQVAAMYDDSGRRQSRRWRVLLPMILGGGIGGALVLFYGLALFLPYIELLTGIASSQAR